MSKEFQKTAICRAPTEMLLNIMERIDLVDFSAFTGFLGSITEQVNAESGSGPQKMRVSSSIGIGSDDAGFELEDYPTDALQSATRKSRSLSEIFIAARCLEDRLNEASKGSRDAGQRRWWTSHCPRPRETGLYWAKSWAIAAYVERREKKFKIEDRIDSIKKDQIGACVEKDAEGKKSLIVSLKTGRKMAGGAKKVQ
ncbi:MAG: hypothetical protein Q9205_006355 [Flavoplaca limonia]